MNVTNQDAVVLLKSDHKKIKELFEECEKRKSTPAIKEMDIAREVCGALLTYMEIEINIFYLHVRQKM